MTQFPTDAQWICEDCYVLLVNGDFPEEADPEILLSAFDGIQVMPGMLFGHDCDDPVSGECDCETKSFSMDPCDGCNGNLGGRRYAVTGWVEA